MRKIDLTGQTFGRLTVLREAGRTAARRVVWRCQCACGNLVDVSSAGLRSKRSQSCGCRKVELSRKRWIHTHKSSPITKMSLRFPGGSVEDLEDLIR